MKEFLKIDYKDNVSPNQDKLILQRPRGANKGGLHTDKSTTLAANAWEQNNLLVTMKENGIIQLNPSRESGGTQPYQQNRVYDTNGQSPALMNGHGGRTINILKRRNASEVRDKAANTYRVCSLTDHSGLVQMDCVRNPAIQNVRQRLDD